MKTYDTMKFKNAKYANRHPFIGVINTAFKDKDTTKIKGWCGFYDIDNMDFRQLDLLDEISKNIKANIYVLTTSKGFHFITLKPLPIDVFLEKWWKPLKEALPSDYTFGDRSNALSRRHGGLPYNCLRVTPKHNNRIRFYCSFIYNDKEKYSSYHASMYRHIIPIKYMVGKPTRTYGISVIRWGKI